MRPRPLGSRVPGAGATRTGPSALGPWPLKQRRGWAGRAPSRSLPRSVVLLLASLFLLGFPGGLPGTASAARTNFTPVYGFCVRVSFTSQSYGLDAEGEGAGAGPTYVKSSLANEVCGIDLAHCEARPEYDAQFAGLLSTGMYRQRLSFVDTSKVGVGAYACVKPGKPSQPNGGGDSGQGGGPPDVVTLQGIPLNTCMAQQNIAGGDDDSDSDNNDADVGDAAGLTTVWIQYEWTRTPEDVLIMRTFSAEGCKGEPTSVEGFVMDVCHEGDSNVVTGYTCGVHAGDAVNIAVVFSCMLAGAVLATMCAVACWFQRREVDKALHGVTSSKLAKWGRASIGLDGAERDAPKMRRAATTPAWLKTMPSKAARNFDLPVLDPSKAVPRTHLDGSMTFRPPLDSVHGKGEQPEVQNPGLAWLLGILSARRLLSARHKVNPPFDAESNETMTNPIASRVTFASRLSSRLRSLRGSDRDDSSPRAQATQVVTVKVKSRSRRDTSSDDNMIPVGTEDENATTRNEGNMQTVAEEASSTGSVVASEEANAIQQLRARSFLPGNVSLGTEPPDKPEKSAKKDKGKKKNRKGKRDKSKPSEQAFIP